MQEWENVNQMKYIEPAVMFITMIVYVAIAVLIGIVAEPRSVCF